MPGKDNKKFRNQTKSSVINDERFASKLSAPIFKKASKEQHKVVLDERFQSMLTDERFQAVPGSSVDKYGRKKKGSGSAKELESLYQIENNGTSDNVVNEASNEKSSKSSKAKDNKPNNKPHEDPEERLNYLTLLARGEVDVSSSDESDDGPEGDDSSSSEDGSDGSDEDEGEDGARRSKKSALAVPEDEPDYGDATNRLSVLNCDWDHLKAADIFMVLQSFCPAGSEIKKVTVYPSDFGKERMAQEAKYGPQGIWNEDKGQDEDDDSDEEDDEDEDEDEDSDDVDEEEGDELYDQIEYEASESDEEASNDDEESNRRSKNKNNKKEEFRRKPGAVGLVMHDELVLHSKSKKNQGNDGSVASQSMDDDGDDNSHKGSKKSKPKETDFDEIKLRQYELSKLRYYFAIVDFDSVDTANTIYEELDGVELENSAMVFDLRFVPDDVDFKGREIRDWCTVDQLPANYSPPEFIVQALQQTNVECTWDQGEKDREKKLTNVSQWRSLQDSDFMQYIASSDSEDDDEEDESESDDDNEDDNASARRQKKKVQLKKEKAKAMRKLLLGDNAGSGSDDDSDSNGSGDDSEQMSVDSAEGEGSFFLDDDAEDKSEDEMPVDSKKKKSKLNKLEHVVNEDGEEEMVFSYIPEAGKDLLQKKKDAELEANMTPYERELKKAAELKKARKSQRTATLEERHNAQQQAMQEAAAKRTKERKNKQVLDDEEDEDRLKYSFNATTKKAMNDDNDGEKVKLSMRQRVKQAKLLKKAKSSAVHSKDQTTTDEATSVDVSDDRFSKLFEGDANFGIDPTSNEYKSSPAIQQIFKEQKKRRTLRKEQPSQPTKNDQEKPEDSKQLNSLVNRLKRKFEH